MTESSETKRSFEEHPFKLTFQSKGRISLWTDPFDLKFGDTRYGYSFFAGGLQQIMTYRGHTYEGMHDGKRKGTYTLDGDPEPYVVDCGSLEDLDRIIKRVIDIRDGHYGAPSAPYDTLEEKSDHGRLDPDLEEGAPN